MASGHEAAARNRTWRAGRGALRLHMLSIFSLAVAFVCLASALLVVTNVAAVRDRWSRAGRATVYLRDGASEGEIGALTAALEGTFGVKKVRYVSAVEARREVIADEKDKALAALPVAAFPASLEVGFSDEVSDEELVAMALKLRALPAVETVETYQRWTERLSSLLGGGVTASACLAVIVLCAVVSVIGSTMRLLLHRRKSEVEVLKLVGATDAFVRRPFVIEGATQGAAGAVAAILMLGVLFLIVRGRVDTELSALLGVTPSFLPWHLALGMVALGASLGALTALISLRKMVKDLMRGRRAKPLAAVAVVIALGAIPAAAQVPPGYVASTQQAELDRQLARADAEEQRLAGELDDARPRLEMTRQRIIARGRAYYRLVRAGLLPAGGGFDAIVDHAARVERTRRSLERDVVAESSLVKRIGEVETKLARVRADRGPLAVQREALLRARQALQEADERRAAFSRAFDASVRPDAVAIYGTDMGPAADALAGFRALRGRLPFPIAGRAEVNRKNHGGGPGVELSAAAGTVVRTVAAGRVAFADRQDEYGLTVIVDHGDHYFSLYGSLGSSDVRAGDTVSAGSRVGTVGSIDGTPPRLYFEIRHNGATLDPGPWLGL